MASEALSESIKTRVPPWIKRQFKRIAKERHLDPADIQREAFRQYLERTKSEGMSVPAEERTEQAVAV